MVKAKFDVAGINPYVFAGPAVGFIVRNTLVGSTGAGTSIAANSIEVSVQGGVGLSMPITSAINGYINGRYMFGLTNILNTTGPNAKTREVLTLAGLQFTNLGWF